MKERQLERAEIAKASIQTEVAETELVNIKREFMSQKGQSQEQLKNLQEALQVRNLFEKQARKGFRPPSAMKGIGYFQNLRIFLESFWIFLGIFLEFFGRIFFGGILLRNFFGGIF